MFEREWKQARGTVVAVKDLTSWTSDPQSMVTQSKPHEYVVDVQPGDEPALRATFRDPYIRGHMDHPTEGQVIDVLYHPKSQKVKLIEEQWKHSDDESERQHQAEEDRFEAAKRGAPGEHAPPPDAGRSRVIGPTGEQRVLRPDAEA